MIDRLLFAPLAVCVHTGCSAFPFYTPTKPLIQLHIKYKTRAWLTLQETRSIHDSINIQKLNLLNNTVVLWLLIFFNELLEFFCYNSFVKRCSLITTSIPMDTKHSFIKGLHCTSINLIHVLVFSVSPAKHDHVSVRIIVVHGVTRLVSNQ